ncbi:MAG: hypothetical protein JWO24_2639, partial [Rhodospirillales bacterium]|nr:hypothetical protein [Rhodospirillales bacterium]
PGGPAELNETRPQHREEERDVEYG